MTRMHRETIIAIGIGLSLGLLVAIGVYQFRQVITPDVAERPSIEATPSENSETDATTNFFELESVLEGTVVSTSEIELTGKINAPVTLILSSQSGEKIIASPEDTTFATSVTLKPGPNILTLIGINDGGQTEQTERLVVYDSTNSELVGDSDQESNDTATPSGETTNENAGQDDPNTTQALLQRINQKLDPDKPETPNISSIDQLRRAYLGQVERVTDESIRLQTKLGSLSLAIEELGNIRKADKKIEADAVEVDNWMLIIGALSNPDDLESLVPEKALVYTSSPRPNPPFATIGSLEKLSRTELELVERATGTTSKLTFGSKYQLLDSEGKVAPASAFNSELSVLVTGYVDGEDRIVTTVRALAPFAKEEAGE